MIPQFLNIIFYYWYVVYQNNQNNQLLKQNLQVLFVNYRTSQKQWQITEETKMVAFIVVVDAMGQKARQKKDV